MYHPHHFLSQIKQMNQRTSVPAYQRMAVTGTV